jgi:hypothetical protein
MFRWLYTHIFRGFEIVLVAAIITGLILFWLSKPHSGRTAPAPASATSSR